jgi:hypothetical protein
VMFYSFVIRLTIRLFVQLCVCIHVCLSCLSNPIQSKPNPYSLLLLWENHIDHLVQQREHQMRTIITS